ncbi:MAG: OLD family endonuclease, partial [Cyanobacteria bacterium P01_E01_bin.35]
KTMGEAKLALVIATGSANIPGMLKILEKMNIPVKALADLDFAFTVAKKHNFITGDNPAVNECLNILKRIQPHHKFKLEGRMPRSGNGFKTSKVYELLAEEADADEHINVLHNELKTNNIWLWSSGAIEPHLCLETKQSGEWFKFKEKLANDLVNNVVEDVEHITEFINWCQS